MDLEVATLLILILMVYLGILVAMLLSLELTK